MGAKRGRPKVVRPVGNRKVVSHLVSAHGFSQRLACRLAELDLSTWQYEPRKQDRDGLRSRLKELASERRRFGHRRLHVLLRREGWGVRQHLLGPARKGANHPRPGRAQIILRQYT